MEKYEILVFGMDEFKDLCENKSISMSLLTGEWELNGEAISPDEAYQLIGEVLGIEAAGPIEHIWYDDVSGMVNFFCSVDTKKHKYKISYDGSEGSCEGTVPLTKHEAEIVYYAMDRYNWDDFYQDPYSADGGIDIENPIELTDTQQVAGHPSEKAMLEGERKPSEPNRRIEGSPEILEAIRQMIQEKNGKD